MTSMFNTMASRFAGRLQFLLLGGIRSRLAVGFGIVLACLAIITGTAYFQLQRTVAAVLSAARSESELAAVTSKMAEAINQMQTGMLSGALLFTPEEVEDQKQIIAEADKVYAAQAQALGSVLARLPSLAELRPIAAELAQTKSVADNVMGSILDGFGAIENRDRLASSVSYQLKPSIARVRDQLSALDAMRRRLAQEQAASLENEARKAVLILLGLASFAIVAGIAAAWVISRSIVQPMQAVVDLSTRISRGDLSNPIEAHHKGEIGSLMRALDAMQAGLRDLVRRVQEAAERIALACNEVASGNQDLSSRTEHSAAELQRTSTSINQLSATVQHTAAAASSANALANETSSSAKRGGDAIAKVAANMSSISSASGKIAEIIGVIDGIAFQTNILALNAAVEAARAGEQGRGFSVVASEVRSLATRSADAAREIKVLIGSSAETVACGEQQVRGAVDEVGGILQGVDKVTAIVAGITNETNTQSRELDSVSHAVGRLESMTQQNAALVEQSAAAAMSLREQCADLQRLVASFQLETAQTSVRSPLSDQRQSEPV